MLLSLVQCYLSSVNCTSPPWLRLTSVIFVNLFVWMTDISVALDCQIIQTATWCKGMKHILEGRWMHDGVGIARWLVDHRFVGCTSSTEHRPQLIMTRPWTLVIEYGIMGHYLSILPATHYFDIA